MNAGIAVGELVKRQNAILLAASLGYGFPLAPACLFLFSLSNVRRIYISVSYHHHANSIPAQPTENRGNAKSAKACGKTSDT